MRSIYSKRSVYINLCSVFLPLFLFSTYILSAQTTQVGLPGDFEAPYEFLNTIENDSIDVDEDGFYDIGKPCSCLNNPPIANGETANGWFQTDLVIATGVSDQLWLVENAQMAFHEGGELLLFPGDTLHEIGNSGVYTLPIWHRSSQQFAVLVEAPFVTPGATYPINARCFYPTPSLDIPQDVYCSFEDGFTIEYMVSTGLGGWIPVTPNSVDWTITRLEDQMQWNNPSFSPENYGPGTYEVSFTVDAGSDAYQAYHSTACSTTVLDTIEVQASLQTMACNSVLNVAVGAACTQTVSPNLILAGTAPPDVNFLIEVTAPDGTNLGDQISALYHGQVLTAEITDECTGSSCETLLSISEFVDPVLSIPADVTLACTESEHTDFTGFATATDCNPVTITYTDVLIEDECANPTIQITRTWRAEDSAGNVTSDEQQIEILRAGSQTFSFPFNQVFSCDEYALDASITDATAEGAGIPTLVDVPRCRLIYTFEDDTIHNAGMDFIILREWVLLDLCGSTVFTEDMNGNSNMQVIRVGDFDAPVLEVSPLQTTANVIPEVQGDPCLSQGFIAPPTSIYDCSEVEVFIHTAIGQTVYQNGVDGLAGGNIPPPGLPLGTHDIVYEAIDIRGNSAFYETTVTITDNLAPVMLCDGSMNITLQPSGLARVYATDVDEGSYDYCCTDELKIKLATEPDTDFREFIDFDCTNDTVEVIVRLWDCFGNFNECSSFVRVADNIPVVLESEPGPVTITCGEDYSAYLTADFMAPVFSDECSFEVSFIAESFLNDCGEGQIIRTWTASDHPGNPLVFASQTIHVQAYYDYEISIPQDQVIDCNDTGIFEDMTLLSSQGCEMITINVTSDTLSNVSTNCFQIARTHHLINWCRYDENEEPTSLPRIDGDDEGMVLGDAYVLQVSGNDVFTIIDNESTLIGTESGSYEYRQIIRFADEEVPQFNVPSGAAFCTNQPGECAAMINIPLEISDNCSQDLTVDYLIRRENTLFYVDTLGALTATETGWEINAIYPVGEYIIQLSATDECGNLNEMETTILIEDCEQPELSCLENIDVFLSQEEGIWVYPYNFVAQATDNCGIADFQINGQDSLWFDCMNIGSQSLNVTARDFSNIQASCTATFQLVDTSFFCSPSLTIEGMITRNDGEEIDSVTVWLMGGGETLQTMTNEVGYYQFADLPPGEDYTIQPLKDDDHPKGVTTLDIIKISKHILHTDSLGDPYRIISADVNRSEGVTTLDLIRIRKIILNIDSMFANTTSWIFIDGAYDFPNPTFPWVDVLPQTVTINNATGNQIVNFTGAKTGDVNNSAVINFQEETTTPRSIEFLNVTDEAFKAGEEVVCTIKADESILAGGQFSLQWPPSMLSFERFIPSSICAEEQVRLPSEGEHFINISWDKTAMPKETIFDLHFIAQSDGKLSEAIGWSREVAAELYTSATSTYFIHQPELKWRSPETILSPPMEQVVSVYPNPFTAALNLTIQVTERQEARLELYDNQGRLLKQQEQFLERGMQRWTIDSKDFGGYNGLIHYRLQIGTNVHYGKVIKL